MSKQERCRLGSRGRAFPTKPSRLYQIQKIVFSFLPLTNLKSRQSPHTHIPSPSKQHTPNPILMLSMHNIENETRLGQNPPFLLLLLLENNMRNGIRYFHKKKCCSDPPPPPLPKPSHPHPIPIPSQLPPNQSRPLPPSPPSFFPRNTPQNKTMNENEKKTVQN